MGGHSPLPPARPVSGLWGPCPGATSATAARQISSVSPSIPTTAGLSGYLGLHAFQPVLVTCCGANAPRLSVLDPDGIKLMGQNYVSMLKCVANNLRANPQVARI